MIQKQFFLPSVMLCLLLSCSHPQSEPVQSNDEGVKIRTTQVKSAANTRALTYSGTIVPYRSIPVSFQTTGTVQSVLVQEGSSVRKGQILATLDKTDLQNLCNVSQAQYQQALDAYNRLKEVHAKGSLADIKWVEMESNLKQAESSLKLAQNSLDKAALRAPESGFIGRRRIEPGMTSIGLTAPFEVMIIDRIYVRVSVPENEISKIKPGMVASFNVPAIGDTPFTGVVSLVGVAADALSRTYEVKVLANNPNQIIKPGMICDLRLEGSQEAVNVVDYRAVTHDESGSYVYKVTDNRTRVVKQPVQTGHVNTEGIEIKAGLNIGDEVACEGLNKLKDNSKITL